MAYRDPALRGLRAAEVPGVHAQPESAVRDPALQLQVPPSVEPSPSLPFPGRGRGRDEGASPMRGLLPFLSQRLLRALIALWLLSTVPFVAMRLSPRPTPLRLPPAAPATALTHVGAAPGPARP